MADPTLTDVPAPSWVPVMVQTREGAPAAARLGSMPAAFTMPNIGQ